MSSLLIMRALPLSAVTVTQTGTHSGSQNLLTPDPKEGWQSDASNPATIDIDLGAVVSIDSFFMGFNTSTVGNWTIQGGTAAYTTTTHKASGSYVLPSDYAAPRRRHSFYRLAAPVSNRYVRLTLQPVGAYSISIIGIGLAIQPAFGREWGSGRTPIDMSSVTDLRGGGFGIERGARKPSFDFTCGDLFDSEVAALWEVAEEVGISAPVVVCEDPDVTTGLNERLHYGLFDRPSAYERLLPGCSRWSFQLKAWT